MIYLLGIGKVAWIGLEEVQETDRTTKGIKRLL